MPEQEDNNAKENPIIRIDETSDADGTPGPDAAPPPPASGGGDWREKLAHMAGKAAEALKALHIDPTITIRWLDGLLNLARTKYPPERFESVADWSVKYGHYGLVAAQVLCLLYGVVAALKLSSVAPLLSGIGYALLIMILQYTASRFIHAGAALLKASPSRIGSSAFLDCLALLSEIAGLLLFLAMLKQAHLGAFFVGLGLWALCDAVAFIALNPAMANVQIATDVRAGEEGIGILSFLPKAVVRIAPIAFGIGTLLGTVGLLCSLFSIIKSGNTHAAQNAIKLIALCACLPFSCYVFFAVYHLAIDLIRAILVIPRKIDDLRGKL